MSGLLIFFFSDGNIWCSFLPFVVTSIVAVFCARMFFSYSNSLQVLIPYLCTAIKFGHIVKHGNHKEVNITKKENKLFEQYDYTVVLSLLPHFDFKSVSTQHKYICIGSHTILFCYHLNSVFSALYDKHSATNFLQKWVIAYFITPSINR